MNNLLTDLFVKNNLGAAATLTWLALWGYIFFIYKKGAAAEKNNFGKTAVSAYEPPKNISPILARYLQKAGTLSREAGDINITAEQLMVLINLSQSGLLENFSFKQADCLTISYKIKNDFLAKQSLPEQKMFLTRLAAKVGQSGVLHEDLVMRGRQMNQQDSNGFKELGDFWYDYWVEDLGKVAAEQGLAVVKNHRFIEFINLSIVFGMPLAAILALFALHFPYLFFLCAILILPEAILFAVIYFFVTILQMYVLANNQAALVFLSFLAPLVWGFHLVMHFGWMAIIASSGKRLYFSYTDKGKEIMGQLFGYKMYLRKVDKDRLTLLKKDQQTGIYKTTLEWLMAFGLLKYEHWFEWLDVNEVK